MIADLKEHAFEFTCADRPTIGIVSLPANDTPSVGVLIVVGGPQYRVGAHRQFVSLARHLAGEGLAAMRFDVRGMGDCVGEHPGFDNLDADLRSAVDAFERAVPTLKNVVLWGLCDGASAACLYADQDPRVAGLILLNPWAETSVGQATTRLKHYYLRRLLARDFWRKLLSGRVDVRQSMRELGATASKVIRGRTTPAAGRSDAAEAPTTPAPVRSGAQTSTPLPVSMANQLLHSHLPLYIALSERDLVARQFEDVAMPLPEWDAVCRLQTLEIARITGADHTLSTPGSKAAIEVLTARWVSEIGEGRRKKTLILNLPRMKSRRLYAKVLFGVVVGLTALDL